MSETVVDLEKAGSAQLATEPTPDQQPYEEDCVAASKSTKFAAFQFYPRDFLADDKVARMTLTEVGIYITLLCYSWRGGGLSSDLAQVARLCRMPAQRFKKIWFGPLSECFVVRGNKLVNPRQEQQRKELVAYVESCSRGGERSAETRRARYGSAQPPKVLRTDFRSEPEVPPNTASAFASASATEEEVVGDATPTVLTFTTIGKGPKTWALTEGRVASWREAYPTLDVLGECRRASAWLDANGRKTASGMPRFLVNWLNRANNNGGARTPQKPAMLDVFAEARAKLDAEKAARAAKVTA